MQKKKNLVVKVVLVAMNERIQRRCKESIKHMSNSYVPDKERSAKGHCCTINRCIMDIANMFHIRNGLNVRWTIT